MLDALVGANVRDTAARLGIRWDQCRDLDQVLLDAQTMARNSRALEFERLRAQAPGLTPCVGLRKSG